MTQEVKEALAGLLDDIAFHIDARQDEEIRSWLMAATLRIWAGNKFFAEDYVNALPVFTGQTYTTAQVVTALDCAGEEGRTLNVPAFFQTIVQKDKADKTSHSRTIADSIGRFLVMMALINGDFTLEEARALREISDLLLNYCDFQGVIAGKTREHHPEMVTPLNQSSYYYQPFSEKKAPSAEASTPKEQTPTSPKDDEVPTITVNLNLTADAPVTPTPPPEKISAEPASGVSIKQPAAKSEGESGETLESVLEELYGLVGLDKVKEDVQSLLNFIKICQLRTQRGMKVPTISYHLVFTGNPGTGKTTVARLVAKLYYLMGILPQGQLVETDRSGLVAGYLGQTAIKTQKVIQEALGGVLFIDEAYALANDEQDSYGKEAIETLLKAMEDHRDELVVIVAGYDELMHKFIDSNPGLRSRFNKYFHFPDYDGADLMRILQRLCKNNGYALSEEATPYVQEKLNEMYENREEHFGNARAVRNLFEHAINQQANRLVKYSSLSDEELAGLTLDDIIPALEVM